MRGLWRDREINTCSALPNGEIQFVRLKLLPRRFSDQPPPCGRELASPPLPSSASHPVVQMKGFLRNRVVGLDGSRCWTSRSEGNREGEMERDGEGYPSSVHVQPSASAAGAREAPPARQFCCRAVPLERVWSLSVFSLSPLHRKLPLACLVRLRRGPEVSKRLARPRIKSPKPRPTSCW